MEANPPQSIFPKVTGNSLIDALVANYNAGIGSASWTFLDGGGAPNIAVIYYLIQTIFTNMMFLNMLIAIMSDTYARITQYKDRNAL
jgi:Ion transport protein